MVPQKVSQSNDESSVLETHAPGVGATTNTQEDLADHAGANREGSVGPLSITPDDLEGVHSDTARFDESIKMPEEEDATGHAQQGLADKDNTEGDTSFGSSNEGSAPGTASTFGGSEGTGASEVIDRDAAMADILEMLGMWPEITLALIDFTESLIGIGEEAEMVTRSSTIVDARHDHEEAFIEFARGVEAICRIVSDERIRVLRDWAVQFKAEWIAAIAKEEEADYSDYVDLMYSEATDILQKGTGEFREEANLGILSEVFGLVVKEA